MSMLSRVLSLALAGVILMPVVAAAQRPQETTFGVKAGVNSSTLNSPADLELKRILGAVAGVFVGRNINDRFSMQVEGLFSQKGAKDRSLGSGPTVRLTYFDLPVLFRFGSTTSNETHFHVFTGPVPSFKLKAESRTESPDVTLDLDDEVESFDFGWTLGAGIERSRFSLDARYTHGFMNVDSAVTADKLKNRVFTILAGVRLK